MDAIANWVWQGSAIAIATTVVLNASRRVSATTRYRLWWIALSAVLLLPFLPALTRLSNGPAPHASISPAVYSVAMPALPQWPATLMIAVWIGWVAWSLLQTVLALAALRRAKQRSREFPPDLEASLARWNRVRQHGRPARLVVSRDVPAAAVLGLAAPEIAVSPAVLRELDAEELEGILLHEWAHVQRRDDVARLVQLIVRAVAGLHPAVWWIDRQLQIDRETACDDWAINMTGSAKRYAACLTKLASLSLADHDALLLPSALSLSGRTSSELTRRVIRLLDRRRSTSTKRPLAATALVAPVMMLLAAIVASVQLVATASPASADDLTIALVEPSAAPRESGRELPAPARLPATQEPASRPHSREREQVSVQVPVTLPGTVVREVGKAPPGAQLSELRPAVPQAAGGLQDLPGQQAPVGNLGEAPTGVETGGSSDRTKVVTPWGAAAGAGVSVGRGSQKAAVATAGFFSKLSRSIADVF